jgi:hypothetical protein
MAKLWQSYGKMGQMQAGRGFILFSIGKSARGLALIEMPFLRREKFVIK